MNGLMMDWPLVIPSILRRAAQFFPEKEIVSRWADGTLHRMNYGELEGRVHRLMNVLRELGVKPGDRVATFAWNHHRHLELYFAVPSIGAVLHTINFRLLARAARLHHQSRRGPGDLRGQVGRGAPRRDCSASCRASSGTS